MHIDSLCMNLVASSLCTYRRSARWCVIFNLEISCFDMVFGASTIRAYVDKCLGTFSQQSQLRGLVGLHRWQFMKQTAHCPVPSLSHCISNIAGQHLNSNWGSHSRSRHHSGPDPTSAFEALGPTHVPSLACSTPIPLPPGPCPPLAPSSPIRARHGWHVYG